MLKRIKGDAKMKCPNCNADLKKVEEVILNPLKHDIPTWMFNRRKDYDTGNDKHILTSDLKLQKDNDIKRLKKIKAYRGIRHATGQPVRGQRTRSNFRRGSAIGVNKKKSKMATAKAPTNVKMTQPIIWRRIPNQDPTAVRL